MFVLFECIFPHLIFPSSILKTRALTKHFYFILIKFHESYQIRMHILQQLGKVPTSILLTEDDSFHSFGKTAEDTYAEKCSNGETDWKLFKNFKMNLYNASDRVCCT